MGNPQRDVRTAALLGVLGAAVAVASDVPTVYSTTGAAGLRHVGQIGTIEGLDPLLLSKSQGELLVGHLLGLVGNPLAIFGIWSVSRAVRPAGRRLSLAVLVGGAYGHVVGTTVHVAYPFMVVALQARAAAGGGTLDRLVARSGAFYEPLGYVALVAFLVAMSAFVYAVRTGETTYPRWVAAANPVTFLVAFHAVAFVAPTPVRVFLVVAGLNLSILAFYSVSAAVLWNRDIDRVDRSDRG